MTENATAQFRTPTKSKSKSATLPQVTLSEQRIIVGSGPVGVRLAQLILEREPEAQIKLFGDEPVVPYNRVQLSALLFGQVSRNGIDLEMPDPYRHTKFEFCASRIVKIDRTNRCVIDQHNEPHPYNQLILAVGARAHIPQIPGTHLPGVYTFRDIRDAEKLKARLARARHIVVVGGGLLGVETARGLQKHNTQVTLVQQGTHLLNKQLDAEAAGLLAESLVSLNIRIHTNAGVRAIEGTATVEQVRIHHGECIPCDTVVLCSGITPNIELARAAKLPVARGILVDDGLQTSDHNIFAIGECAEHRGITYGLVNPGFEQAAVLADRLAKGSATYSGSMSLSRLKLLDRTVFAFGEPQDAQKQSRQQLSLIYRQRKTQTYRKITLHRNRITGIIGLGDWPGFSRVQAHAEQQRRITFIQRCRFRLWGEFWSRSSAADPSHWPKNTLVCQCQHVNCGQLTRAIEHWSKDQRNTLKMDILPYLKAETKAGTICGSCTPIIEKLCTHSGLEVKRTMVDFGKILLITACLSALVILIFYATPPAQKAISVTQKNWFETIWADKFWKQFTGFSILAICIISLALSFRKHLKWRWLGNFGALRALHGALGALCLILLILHTGFHWGANLNQLLLVNFLTLCSLGLTAAFIVSNSHKLPIKVTDHLQRWSYWAHLILAWPLPVLLGLHILTVYYF